MKKTHIIGAGLAGSEAAYFLALKGHSIVLHEMRPTRKTEAHHTDQFAELVCSNSLKSTNPDSAPGLLKQEMRHLGSLVLDAAERARVPGGEALTVDRDLFSGHITKTLSSHPKISISRAEVSDPDQIPGLGPEDLRLIATGPLTSAALSNWIAAQAGQGELYFYDAIAPIIDAESLDRSKVFLANRYGKGGEEAYLNCPMSESEYHAFIDALTTAEKVAPKSFEQEKFFQGCQPIEAIAATGRDTLRFGPMKPVGLDDPRTGKRPYAVVQLRPENKSLSAYNMVGFQTKLKYGEQGRVFKLIPGLENAKFLRLGSIHRNTFICSPKVLRPDLSMRGKPKVYFAGQITGVEGYLESAACGLLAAVFIDQRLKGLPHNAPPATTAMGSILGYLMKDPAREFQPTNINFSLFDLRLVEPATKEKIIEVSFRDFKQWASS